MAARWTDDSLPGDCRVLARWLVRRPRGARDSAAAMSCAALAIGFAVVGSVCELAGLAIVVRGILRDRDRARRLFVRQRRARPPERTYPGRQMASPLTPSWARPMHGDQLRAIVEYVSRMEASVADGLIGIRRAVDTELDNSVELLRREMAEQDGVLRDGLRDVLAGSIRDRWLGVVLLGLGIVFAMVGSVLGTLARPMRSAGGTSTSRPA